MAKARTARGHAKSAPDDDGVLLARRADEELSRAVLRLLDDEPFFAHLLGSVARGVSAATPSACVALEAGQVALWVNAHFFVAHLSALERVAVLKHEALHLLFRHLFRLDLARHDRALFNIAADLVVNQYIGGRLRLPAGAVTLKTFADLALEPEMHAEYYYARLHELRSGSLRAPVSREALDELLARACATLDDHGPWGRGEVSDAAIAEGALERAVVQSARRSGPRGWSALPAPLRALVDAAIARMEPELDWRRALALFAESSRRSRVVETLRRPSRRFGTMPGTRVRRGARLAVAIDTSGSVSDADLALFFAELDGMHRRGAELTVFECDAAVQRVYRYDGRGPPAKVAGRGGTLFEPFFRALRDQRTATARFDGCVYLTDGEAPPPKTRPTCRLLWVLTADARATLPFGRTVRLTRVTP